MTANIIKLANLQIEVQHMSDQLSLLPLTTTLTPRQVFMLNNILVNLQDAVFHVQLKLKSEKNIYIENMYSDDGLPHQN